MRISTRHERRRRQRQRQRVLMLCLGLMLVAIPLLGTTFLPKDQNTWLKTPDGFYHPEWMTNLDVKPEAQALKALPLAEEDTELRTRLETLLANYPQAQFKPHLFYMNLKTGQWVSINGTDAVPAASVIKLPVLMEYFRQMDKGTITPYTHLMYESFEQASGSGELQFQTPGRPLLAQEVARQMIQTSDNSCTNILIYNLGGSSRMNRIFEDYGLTRTHIENWLPDLTGTNTVSMRDTATLLYNIYAGEVLSPESREMALDILKGTHNRRLLPGLLPQDTVIAHKTGDIGTSLGDSGMIFMPGGNDFILTMQVERPYNNYTGKDMIQQAAKVVYDYQAGMGTLADAQ